MTILRLKTQRRKEELLRKTAELMNRYKVPGFPTYEYQPIGASSISDANPTIAKTKGLFQMFHIDR